jgi:2-polyprenyl-3-methyl-5-hydroxy-6-metoxy-1,4-benzoquinol methylase
MLKENTPLLDLSVRSMIAEEMDQQGSSILTTERALREIGTINKWLGGYTVILDALGDIEWPGRTVTIMDLGCGGGDTLRAIAAWAAKKKKTVKLIGVDRNPIMTQYAARKSRQFTNIEYLTLSVFDEELLSIKADITMNSLFCHHFDNGELVRLISVMRQIASHSVIINDIDRHWLAYYSIKLLTSVFSKTYMVKYDAPLSVARSLTRDEWKEILYTSGISQYSLRWMWAWRWQIIIPQTQRI